MVYNITKFDLCIKDCKVCVNCPGRLSARISNRIPKYIGNPMGKYLFVLPLYNSNKRNKLNTNVQIDTIRRLYKEVYNREFLEDCLVTWAVRCPDFENRDYSIDSCKHILYNITKINKFEKIIFAGYWLYTYMCSKFKDISKFRDIVDISSVLLEYFTEDRYKEQLKALKL